MSVVILMSGGLDSTVMASLAMRRGGVSACVFIDWGQPAVAQERRAARGWCERNGVRLIERSVDLDCGAMAIGSGERGSRMVRFRNLTFCAIAASVADSVGASQVHLGAIADDHADYPDCRRSWVREACHLMGREGVSLKAPLIDKTKDEVRALADAMAIDTNHVWSCYEPADGEPCGDCNSCNQ